MIKPVERPSGMGNAPPYAAETEVVAEWIIRLERAVNMLIEEHNALVRILKHRTGPAMPHDVEYEFKDPNEASDD